ncbi:MAG: hypothetical protein AAGF11_34740 [Myxococcota bacterium]
MRHFLEIHLQAERGRSGSPPLHRLALCVCLVSFACGDGLPTIDLDNPGSSSGSVPLTGAPSTGLPPTGPPPTGPPPTGLPPTGPPPTGATSDGAMVTEEQIVLAAIATDLDTGDINDDGALDIAVERDHTSDRPSSP